MSFLLGLTFTGITPPNYQVTGTVPGQEHWCMQGLVSDTGTGMGPSKYLSSTSLLGVFWTMESSVFEIKICPKCTKIYSCWFVMLENKKSYEWCCDGPWNPSSLRISIFFKKNEHVKKCRSNKHNNNNSNSDNPLTSRRSDGGKNQCENIWRPILPSLYFIFGAGVHLPGKNNFFLHFSGLCEFWWKKNSHAQPS